MEKKYIHYCWFGGKPLPKKVKKYIKTWKKFLPDYELMEWNESNFDININDFCRQAYENGKWAFVSDVARVYALSEYGGIYFDTDVEVTKNISDVIKHEIWLGREDENYLATAMIGVKKPKNKHIINILKVYENLEFDVNNLYKCANPKIFTSYFNKLGLEIGDSYQILKDDVCVYPKEYFNPKSYDGMHNKFTENTCMIHHFDASWISPREKFELNMVRKLGKSRTNRILNLYRKIKSIIRRIVKFLFYPCVLLRRHYKKMKLVDDKYNERLSQTIENIKKYKNSQYIAIHNREFFGVTSASLELFSNNVDCGELYRKKDIRSVAHAIVDSGIKQVIINAMPLGQDKLAVMIKKYNHNIKVKVYWHGSHSQVLDSYGWNGNTRIVKLMRKGVIDCFATCKKSMLNFYLNQGLNACFLTNVVHVDVPIIGSKNSRKGNNEVRIGLYAAKCDDWRKNMFSQMAAISLIPNAVIDMVPLNDSAKSFASILGVKLDGVDKSLKREDLISRMSNNDLNIYVTFSECAPMLPLESFEVGVPCLTGNNHHYFENSILEKFLVVDNEENPIEIKEKLLACLDNKKQILKLYKEFKVSNDEIASSSVKDFLSR